MAAAASQAPRYRPPAAVTLAPNGQTRMARFQASSCCCGTTCVFNEHRQAETSTRRPWAHSPSVTAWATASTARGGRPVH
eukprot:3090135-Lingulodinium_polyedra.AAC.1